MIGYTPILQLKKPKPINTQNPVQKQGFLPDRPFLCG